MPIDPREYNVSIGYDQAEQRYYVLKSDIQGLNVETKTFEDFVEVVLDVAPDLVGNQMAISAIKFEREA
jgi:succinyl-CoA synthetase beta subunit